MLAPIRQSSVQTCVGRARGALPRQLMRTWALSLKHLRDDSYRIHIGWSWQPMKTGERRVSERNRRLLLRRRSVLSDSAQNLAAHATRALHSKASLPGVANG